MQRGEIEYSEISGCPGKYFHCSAWNVKLSTSSCAGMWNASNSHGIKPDPESRTYLCYNCNVGASHADRIVESFNPWYQSKICRRCHKGAERIIHDELCVSCYNREREVIVGRNGRGAYPIRHKKLSPRRVLVSTNGDISEIVFQHTVDTTELFVSIVRHYNGVVFFGFKGHIA